MKVKELLIKLVKRVGKPSDKLKGTPKRTDDNIGRFAQEYKLNRMNFSKRLFNILKRIDK